MWKTGAREMAADESLIHTLMKAITDGDPEAIDRLLHPDLVSHGALGDVEGPEGFESVMLTNVKRAFPDAEVRAEGVIQDGELISWRIVGSGTHTGPFLGIEPTGRTIRIKGIHQGRIADGRLIEHWQGPDILAMLIDMDKLPTGPTTGEKSE